MSNNQSENPVPISGNQKRKNSELIPRYYRTDTNKKFIQATLDQLTQPGAVKKVTGFIGRQNAKSSTTSDIFVSAVDSQRKNYQLEPGMVVKDTLDNVEFYKDYIDYINQLSVLGADVSNHERLNRQELYSWNPHIDWDKFVNFQQYYWLPYGPSVVEVYGNQRKIDSTYTVQVDDAMGYKEYLFTPNGLTRNPALKLYRGQTYNFEIVSPGEPFSIKTEKSLGDQDRYDWGDLTTFAIEKGTISITIPLNAPKILYYVSENNADLGGVFKIYDIKDNTEIDVENQLIGKRTYKLPDGTPLSNGMKLKFRGQITPEKYAQGLFYVEGVGTSITLINERDLEIITSFSDSFSVPFDDTPFDQYSFDVATSYGTSKDYLTINRASTDKNPWSRYNRWFHQDVIKTSAKINGQIASLDQDVRAIRPIIEFQAGLKLYNFGIEATLDVDLIDTVTADVFSTIEGQLGYAIDGVRLIQNQRILFVADTDILVKNKIYRVDFINVTPPGEPIRRQIHLVEETTPFNFATVLVKYGLKNQGLMYWYDQSSWVLAQNKTGVNQAPLFDIVDQDGTSYGNITVYGSSTFIGTKLFSYKVGSGVDDSKLGFPLSYKNINNIGDIVFNFNILSDTFIFKSATTVETRSVALGKLIKASGVDNLSLVSGWEISKVDRYQPVVRIYRDINQTNDFNIDVYDNITDLLDLEVRVYLNGKRLDKKYWEVKNGTKFKYVHLDIDLMLADEISYSSVDVITLKTFAVQAKNSNGYYEVPINLQNNPMNDSVIEFTLGEVIDHVDTIIDNLYTFEGVYLGSSNLRDLGNVSPYGTRFVQHAGPLPLALYHITNKSNNIIKALEQSKNDYGAFKRSFISVSENLGIDTAPVQFVDLILNELNKNKPKTASYYFSDMVAFGAAITTNITVVDYRIKTYPLSATFTLDTLSTKAVLVYLNNEQLLYELDYTFNSEGFIVLTSRPQIENKDVITIVEYDSTDGSFVPSTPTKLGMWPKYEPMKFLDTTLITPREVIQGHDGSIILAYGDYRDDLLLELEKRIFNNIKIKYDPTIFNVDDLIPRYAVTNDYTLAEFNKVLAPNFYQWTSFIGRDFTKPLSYDKASPFTFNYSSVTAPDGRPSPGYWRGLYKWVYDTDRPHLCPWEMLGFSIMPDWWETLYGQAPYTSDNTVMWQDISESKIKVPGMPEARAEGYAKPYLMDYIPVNEYGELKSPIDTNLISGAVEYTSSNDFIFGDNSPIEAAWRRSSYYPFSVISALLLTYPARVMGVLFDRSRIIRDQSGQLVYKDTSLRLQLKDIVTPSVYTDSIRVQTAGLVNYIIDYIQSDNQRSLTQYKYDLVNSTIQLAYRVSGFTEKEKFNLLLDSKNPTAVGGVYVPQENFSIFLNSSSPIKKIVYSGVIITKLSTGYEVKGYSKSNPYFYYYPWINPGYKINIGGISESYSIWTSDQQYLGGKIVQYNNAYYRSSTTHTTGSSFDSRYYQPLSALPITGGKDAMIRTSWDRTEPVTVAYGTKFRTIQEVVDFLVGYGEYLKDQGFVFDTFNTNLEEVTNWITSAKEFLFWTTQNWSNGEDKWADWSPETSYRAGEIVQYNGDYYEILIDVTVGDFFDIEARYYRKLEELSTVGASVLALSPSAEGLTINSNLSVIEDITDQFNVYEFFKVDGTKLDPDFINSYRDENQTQYSPRNDSIYGAAFYFVQKEHIALLDNSTLFNDTIYQPTTGYRQEKIKLLSYASTGWYGGFDIPGFIYDQANISTWNEWTDYNLGDTVKYKEFYYSASSFISGAVEFDSTLWIKLDKKPTSKLLPNWSYKAEQFTDFYSLDSDNFDAGQQKVAQHLIGYQKRQYLENIIKDDISEYKFYQGMIIEKGTQNVLNKLFDVLSADNLESLKFFEEWAVRVGQYGSVNAFDEIEFELDESLFKSNPQAVELVTTVDNTLFDFVIRQTPNDIYLKPLGYNSNPWPTQANAQPYLRTPGYVKIDEVSDNVGTLDEMLTRDITLFNEGDYVWAGFEGRDWNVYRLTKTNFKLIDISYTNSVLTLTVNTDINLVKGNVIGIINAIGVQGFYKISSVSLNVITISQELPDYPDSVDYTQIILFYFDSQRISSIDDANPRMPKVIKTNELLWVDDNGTGKWSVYKHTSVYAVDTISYSRPQNGLQFGKSIALDLTASNSAVSNSKNEVHVYNRVGYNSPWQIRQVLELPFNISTTTLGEFGASLAFSSTSEWLAVGTPDASKVLKTEFPAELDVVPVEITKTAVTWSTSASVKDSQYVKVIQTDATYYYQSAAHLQTTATITAATAKISLPSTVGIYVGMTVVFNATTTNTINLGNLNIRGGDPLVPGDLTYYVKEIVSGGINIKNSLGTLITPTVSGALTATIGNLNTSTTKTTASVNAVDVFRITVATTVGMVVGMKIVFTGRGFGGIIPGFRYYIHSIFSNTQITISETFGGAKFEVATSSGSMTAVTNSVFSVTRPGSVGDITPLDGNYHAYGTNILSFKARTSTYANQGMVTLYQKQTNGQYNYYKTFISPVSGENEYFGSVLKFIDDDKLLITAPQSDNSGKVYRFDYDSTDWASNGTIGGAVLARSLEVSTDNSTLLISAPGVNENDGAVYIYKNLTLLDTLSGIANSHEHFGSSVTVSDDGTYIGVSSNFADNMLIDQGKVTIYKKIDDEYTVFQTIIRPYPEQGEKFGTKISFMNDSDTLVIFSINGDNRTAYSFDDSTTVFDNGALTIIDLDEDSGRVDIYDRYATKWIFSESLPAYNTSASRYGTGFEAHNNHILVSAPYAINTELVSGAVYDYTKASGKKSWAVDRTEIDTVNLEKIKQVFLYNKKTKELVEYLDIIDPVQGKIAGIADQEIKFKTYYDPAIYSIGTEELNVDDGQSWTTKNVGMLWWNLTNAKFLDSYNGDIVYQNSTWNTLYTSGSIDVYEWVASTLLPEDWDAIADTQEGLANNISGTSLYGNSAYSVKQTYDNIAQTIKNTYYFWVKNKTVVPNIEDRTISARDVANLIENPKGFGYKYIAFTGKNSFSLVNVRDLLKGTDINLYIEYWLIDDYTINSHHQWKLISDDINTSLPASIENKWIDSLCGKDSYDRVIPDISLPPKLRYGIENRPRQGMFINRYEALKQYIERVNDILMKHIIVEECDLTDLTSYEEEPAKLNGEYDVVKDTDSELRLVGTASIRTPSLVPVIEDGKIVDVTIIETGAGYVNAPYLIISGSGIDAKIKTVLSIVGGVSSVIIENVGEGYDISNTTLSIRPFSALVHFDSTAFDKWSIHAYDLTTETWSRVKSQSFDVSKYWNYADWYQTGYTEFTPVNFSLTALYELSSISVEIGQVVKINTVGSGGWLLLEKYADSTSVDYTQSYNVVGREKGTIQFSSTLYKFRNTGLGYDGPSYDGDAFDNVAVKELRVILETVRDKILIDNLKQEYLDLFFASLRYVHNEQQYVDWAFKTSFIRAQHNVGELKETVTYNNDNLSDFEQYISEVKPYRTKIREFVSSYSKVDTARSVVTDFDLSPVYLNGAITTIPTQVVDGKMTSELSIVEQDPWKNWYDNVGFQVIDIVITDGGSDYLSSPTVTIRGTSGSGAVAKAYITNGYVNRVSLVTKGSGYFEPPEVVFEGGLDETGVAATASAQIGNSLVRSNYINIKFDRTSGRYYVTELQATETFSASGSQTSFNLKWSPSINLTDSTVLIDGVSALRDSYSLSSKKTTSRGYTSRYGVLTFVTAPAKGAVVEITYTKDFNYLSAADRINWYYNPGTNEFGKELSQLMKGVDYGGVQISGFGFSVSQGWGSLPWFSDAWDALDPTFDDYIITVGASNKIISSTAIQTYAYGNIIEISDISNISVGRSIEFTGSSIGGIPANSSYYVQSVTPINPVAIYSVIRVASTKIMSVRRQNGYVAVITETPHGYVNDQLITITGINIPDFNQASVPIYVVKSEYEFTYENPGDDVAAVISTTPSLTITGATVPIGPAEFVGSISNGFSAAGTILDVTSVTSGTLAVGQLIYGDDILEGTYILSLGTGTGAEGTYIVSKQQLIVSETITATLVVTFTFREQILPPEFNYQFRISGNSNDNYNGEFIGTLISLTSVTIVYPYDPGVFDIISETTIEAAGLVFADNPTVTIRTQVPHGLVTGNTVSIDGGEDYPTFINNDVVVTVIDSDQFTYASSGATTEVIILPAASFSASVQITMSTIFGDALFEVDDDTGLMTIKNKNYPIDLPYIPTIGEEINAYFKPAAPLTITVLGHDYTYTNKKFTRLDDTLYIGTPLVESPNVVMEIFLGDGVANTMYVPNTLNVLSGDTFIFRKKSSDGSIKPQDIDYDTELLGGNLAYTSATGLAADDIIVDGDDFVSPTTSGGTEECVPGQISDAVAIKVHTRPTDGSANMIVKNYISDGDKSVYSIGQTPNSPNAIIVKYTNVDRVLVPNVDYTIDYKNNSVMLDSVPPVGEAITIISAGFNGSNLLDLDSFIADGNTSEFVTQAPWSSTLSSLVYVNGEVLDYVLFNTDSTYEFSNLVGIRFGTPLDEGAVLNYVITSSSDQSFSMMQNETFETDGESTGYLLVNNVGTAQPLESNMLVVSDTGTVYLPPRTEYFTIVSQQATYSLSKDKVQPYSVVVNNLFVYIDGVEKKRITDYTVDLSGVSVILNSKVYSSNIGKQLVITVIQDNSYHCDGRTITFDQVPDAGQTISVISFYKHNVLDINQTARTVSSSVSLDTDSIEYFDYRSIYGKNIKLTRPVINNSYVWLSKNGKLLQPNIDYKLNLDLASVYLEQAPETNDQFSIMTFSSNIVIEKFAFMQFKDMLNRVHYKRLLTTKQTALAQPLHWNDTSIVVETGSILSKPNPDLRLPGILEIFGERIEYYKKQGNTLSQLRRGTLGTGVRPIYETGTVVQDIGRSETIPYKDTIYTEQKTSDGSLSYDFQVTPAVTSSTIAPGNTWYRKTSLSSAISASAITAGDYCEITKIGSSDFTEAGSSINTVGYRFYATGPATGSGTVKLVTYSGIPLTHGQSNDVEIFVGGYNIVGEWTAKVSYTLGDVVFFGTYSYRCTTAHTSSTEFDDTKWEFFTGNIRLSKVPYKVHNTRTHSESPEGDAQFEADFSVDGTNNTVRLTTALSPETKITLVKRTGHVWADAGSSLAHSNNAISRFIQDK